MSTQTIVALSTPQGSGAIGVIRLSGPEAVSITDTFFKGRKRVAEQASHTVQYGKVISNSEIIDEVVITRFRGPNSYTGEDVVEISCHGSPYIIGQILQLCITYGASPARPGEFTQRAFFNGRLDLTQAEAVADLIASESAAAHKTAMHQLRGGFSSDLRAMRDELIHFAALIELELDFSQEDVEFADRQQLYELLNRISQSTDQLIRSFSLGNAMKHGVAVAIIGRPNAGKSTLLNALLNEERAIVSDIAGTTRDTIEETINIDGILYRFIDTAGIRNETSDIIEQKGIERSRQKAQAADVVIELIDEAESILGASGADAHRIFVINKSDVLLPGILQVLQQQFPQAIQLSAKNGTGIEQLKDRLKDTVIKDTIPAGSTIITNTRHMAALQEISAAVVEIKTGMDTGLTGDLLAHHIRQALFHIGTITGEVQHDRDILGAIFGKFCIGK